jgi:chloride channel protein, CIC family
MSQFINFFSKLNFFKLLILAVFVGVCGGLGSVIFHHLIDLFTWLFFGAKAGPDFLTVLKELPWYYKVAVPAIGGLLVGLIVEKSALREIKGEGVPEVMEALAVSRGVITPRVAPLKILISAITLGSGGSAGREGPIIQIGSAIGSSIGQKLKLDTENTRLLLAAGAAAGIAGTFGAPLAGIVFSAEILLKKLTAGVIIVLMIAALTGSFVANYVFGLKGLSFSIINHNDWALLETPAVIGLGVLAAFVAIIFGLSLHQTRHVFNRLNFIKPYLRPALGGLLIGIMSLFLPLIQEPPSYSVMTGLLQNPATMTIAFLLLVLVAKIVATSITLGSGGSGGILAPTLFIGTLLGSAYSTGLDNVLPSLINSPSVYAVLGMAGVLTAVAHAPLTAVIVVMEIVNVPDLLVPLMMVSAVSYIIVKALKAKSVYSVES